MDENELSMLRNTVRQILTTRHADSIGAALAELGWSDVFASDPALCTAVLFGERGRSLSTAPLFDATALAMLGRDDDPSTAVVLRRANGTAIGSLRATSASTLVALMMEGPDRGAVVEVASSACEISTVTGIEASPSMTRVVLADSADGAPVDGGPDAVSVAAIAHAAEILGAAQQLLVEVCDYVRDRKQFGRPIGEFQAVKHRLSACHVAQEAARVALEHATTELDATAVAFARALAGRAGAITVGLAPHVMGAMGFVWEVNIHHFHKRVVAIDAVAGPWERLTKNIGSDIITSGRAPRLGAA